ncbi:uncharacterized protein LOC135822433 [Sycon ciliatum]|uniref:uncharacterized protein LOC135822433 n=1 Tax=Sycon ciliatum TaxID=27933 RepID=UPI0031F6A65B
MMDHLRTEGQSPRRTQARIRRACSSETCKTICLVLFFLLTVCVFSVEIVFAVSASKKKAIWWLQVCMYIPVVMMVYLMYFLWFRRREAYEQQHCQLRNLERGLILVDEENGLQSLSRLVLPPSIRAAVAHTAESLGNASIIASDVEAGQV